MSYNLAFNVRPNVINCRVLSYLIPPKFTNGSSTIANSNTAWETPREKEREYYFGILSAISNSITSIGDAFRDVTARDESKSVKFPENLLNVLENRLENIAMGKDSA